MQLQDELRDLLKILCSTSPAFNGIVQMLFILPEKSRKLIGMYPELMEKEDDLRYLFSLKYTEDGRITYSDRGFGRGLIYLYKSLFELLGDADKRRHLLEIANISEDEFKEFDPLRAWIEVSFNYLAKHDRDSLKLLDAIISELSKGEYIYLDGDDFKRAVKDLKDFESSLKILERFCLIVPEGLWIYRRGCYLLPDAYSDLRDKLKELLKQ
uniref:Uncharacterized protein n=1 Tax=Archaeoglobus fulgidus TaxID=2234 RepID=A0A7J2TLL5_ARCFL